MSESGLFRTEQLFEFNNYLNSQQTPEKEILFKEQFYMGGERDRGRQEKEKRKDRKTVRKTEDSETNREEGIGQEGNRE